MNVEVIVVSEAVVSVEDTAVADIVMISVMVLGALRTVLALIP